MYLPPKNISTHPRYTGSGVFGSIGKVLGKLTSKASGEAAKKLAKKAVSTAGEQASKAILKKTQEVADKGAAQLIDKAMKKMAKPKAVPKAVPKVVTQAKEVLKAVPKVSQSMTPEALINNLIAGSGSSKPLQKSNILTLQDIINRGINTPFLPSPFAGSGIKTL